MFIIIIFIAVIIFGGVMYYSAYLNSQEVVSITIKDKERIDDNNGSKYLIFTENEVFQNTDELIKGKFNSSDVYNQLDIGEVYECEVIGWRLQFFSMYRNIIKCK